MALSSHPPRPAAPTAGACLAETRESPHFLTFSFLAWMLERMILLSDEWDSLPPHERDELSTMRDTDRLLDRLVEHHLLTAFQAETVKCGYGDDLIVGNYRLLNLIGRGGMGSVYRAEHLYLRRQVAVKVLTRSADESPLAVERFNSEARAVSRLQHPNIIACFDAGRARSASPTNPARDFFVMELIPGRDLFDLVRDSGPLAPRVACDVFRQIADALSEAHRLGLIHRDIKPSNILVTPDWKAKVLDFGLARVPNRNMTVPGSLLGTVGYMAPEQVQDPTQIDARADLFALGATMYWALTGEEPYPETGNVLQDLQHRLVTPAAPLRTVRPAIPEELSEVVSRLMDLDPEQRFPSAQAVVSTLAGLNAWLFTLPTAASAGAGKERVLVVDDDDLFRAFAVNALEGQFEVMSASNGPEALAKMAERPPCLLISDVNMPGMSGTEVLARAGVAVPGLKTMLISGEIPEEALAGLIGSGADEFLMKPFSPSELLARVRGLLLRRVQHPTPSPATETMRIAGAEITRKQAAAPPQSCSVELLAYAVSRLLAEIGVVSDGHCARVGHYARLLAAAAPAEREYARLKDESFVSMLAAVAPLYDIGNLVIPPAILMKPDGLDATEMATVQSHAAIGSDLVFRLAGRFAAEAPSLPIAAEVVRSHHERWDGTGYPDELRGAEIPLAARVIAVAAAYESLRTRRPHRPPLSHAQSVRLIAGDAATAFDPVIVTAFLSCAAQFERMYQ